MTGDRRTYEVLVCGGGAFGSTLASLLAANGKKTAIWVRSQAQADEINNQHSNGKYLGDAPLDPGLKAVTDLGAAVPEAPVILMAIPTQALRSVARVVGDYLKGDQILAHAAKGLELGTYKRVSEILREETCARKIGVISGPNLAKEMIQGQPAGALIASRYPEVCRRFQDLYQGSLLRLYNGSDVIGTEICGAFKNIIAFMVGIAHGKGFKDNTKSLLVTRGLNEMVQFGVTSGAEFETFGGLAGVGDLMATCYSPFSRNRTVGERVGQGENWRDVVAAFGSVVEGITTTQAVYEKAIKLGLDLPIVTALYRVLYENAPIDAMENMLMSLPVGAEISRLSWRQHT